MKRTEGGSDKRTLKTGGDHKAAQRAFSKSTNGGRTRGSPDSRLLERILQKDVTAFEKLYNQHARLVYSLALRILRHASTAEEVVQDIFLRVWRNAASYDQLRGPFLPWLLTLSRNKALDHLQSKGERQRRRENQVDEFPSLSVVPGFEATVDKKRQLERVRAAIETLQPEQRRAIELAYFEELTHSEIAAKLHTPLGTIKGWIRNGMMDLKEKLLETTSVTGRTKRLFLSSNMAKNREDYPDCG